MFQFQFYHNLQKTNLQLQLLISNSKILTSTIPLKITTNYHKMHPTGLRLPQSVSRIVEHVNTITSLEQCQSRIESRISVDEEHLQEYQQQIQNQYDSLNQWLSAYTYSKASKTFLLSNASTLSNPVSKYQSSQQENNYFRLNLKQLANLQINAREFLTSVSISKSTKTIKSRTSQDLYLQFSLQFFHLESNQLIGNTYLSEYFRLQASQNIRDRYMMQESILLYFYYHKSFQNIAIQIHFYVMLCEKEAKLTIVLDKQSIGTILIELNQSSKSHYFLEHTFESYFSSQNHQKQKQKQYQVKKDEYAEIEIISSPFEGFSTLSTILLPFKIYTTDSKVKFAKNMTFPQNIDSFRFSHPPYTLSFQLHSIIIPQSQITTAKSKCQNLIKYKYTDLQTIQQIQVKQYRMTICCHNGDKIMSAASCLLKKGKIQIQTQDKNLNHQKNINNYQNSKNRITNESNYLQKINRDSTKDNQLRLINESLTNLEFVFNMDGIVIVCQIFSRIEIKFQTKSSSKQLSQSFFIPLSYLVKPIVTLENDVKYVETLYHGQLFGPKGIEGYLEQQKRKIQDSQKSKIKTGKNIVSYEKILLKAQIMTQSTIQFYVLKEKKDGPNRYHTNLSDSKDMSLSLSVVQKGHGNDINRLIMQKARIQRQRQKMQQKIHKMNIEKNNKIPLLDPTGVKAQIYQQKIKKMRDSKYQLKTTLNYLKSKLDQFQRKQLVRNELIHDTLGKVFGQNLQNTGEVNFGQKLIGAKGGMNVSNKRKEQEHQEQEGRSLRTVIAENSNMVLFEFSIENIIKLIKYLKQSSLIEIVIQNLKFFDENQEGLKSIDIYCGFDKLHKTTFKAQTSQIGGKNQEQIKIKLQLPSLSPNLLSTLLFSPFSLYFVYNDTHRPIGNCFIYFKSICGKIVNPQQHQISSMQNTFKLESFTTFVFSKATVLAKLDVTLSIGPNPESNNVIQNEMHSITSANKSINDELQNKFSGNQKSEDEKRKLMRIENFKKKTTQPSQAYQQGVKLNSEMMKKAEKQYSRFKVSDQLTGEKLTVKYYSLSYNILNVNLKNETTQTKNYQISINDPDAAHLCQLSPEYLEFQQLGFVANQQNLIKKGQKTLSFDQKIKQFYLEPHNSGTLILQYSSRRKYFAPKLQQIRMQHLRLSQSPEQELLQTYNHKRNINITISSEEGVQKVLNINIQPQRDANTVNLIYHFQEQSQFVIPLPLCDLIQKDNLYFEDDSIELIQHDNQMYLSGFAPELNKVILFDVFVFPKPNLFGKLAQQIQVHQNDDNFEEIQMMKKLIYSQKVITLSFEVWGCHRAKQFDLRLFEQTDVLWEISKFHFSFGKAQANNKSQDGHSISDFQPHIYLSSLNPKMLGFRSTKFPTKINSSKNIALNFSLTQDKTLVKSVITPMSIKSQSIVVQAQNQQNRNDVLCRYLINFKVQKPYFEENLVFELQMNQLQQILEENKTNKKYSKEESQAKTLKQSFFVDISNLVNDISEKNPSQIEKFIQKELKFHSSQSCLKLISIKQQTDSTHIRQFVSRKQQQKKAKRRQQMGNQNSQNKKNLAIKKDLSEKKNSKKISSASQSIIARITLELNSQLFAQIVKLSTREYTSKQTNHMKLFEKALMNCLNLDTPFVQMVIGLSRREKILYFKVDISKKTQSNERHLSLMKQILERSQLKLKQNSAKPNENKINNQQMDLMKLFKF